jgi:3-oxosteroid 1-dehydrogenase
VVTTKDGKEWRIGAKLGVLINAGGFAQNQAMRDKYIPNTSSEWTGTIEGDTGEMIQEMMTQGAAVAQMGETIGCQMALPPGRENKSGNGVSFGTFAGQMDIAKPHGIIVDQTGVRYMSEGSSYSEFCMNMRKRHEQVPAIPSLWIMDDQYMKTYMFCGTMPGKAKKQEWYDSGWLKKADTIEELATLCNIDPAVLKATVDRFNADARTGVDRQFHRGDRAFDQWLGDALAKGNNSLGTIVQGPFYAVQVVPGDVSTFGGVVTDTNGRVLREDGTPIPGLYATGVSTASVFGSFAVGAGASIGPSFTWGYVAAKHAANADNIAG